MTTKQQKDLETILRALLLMYYQYCEKGHSCMSAGEEAFEILLQEGLIKDEGGNGHFSFTEKGINLIK